ncbi:MAG: hypothetical protein WCH57_03585 [Verrucomicrobiota bacterium]
MRLRNTILTGVASYIQMGAMVLTQLAAIPLALHFLDTQRFGLWSFTVQSLGYLLLLDFGVTNSIGRLMVEPLHNGDERTWNGWFNLILAVLMAQAFLVFSVGWTFVDSILHWFNIPPALFTEARQLWLVALTLNALNFPFRLLPGILGAQNRFYWYLLSTTLGAVTGLGVFYGALKMGHGSLSYGFSMATQILLNSSLTLTAVLCGPHRFRISWKGIPWCHARHLFGFSSAVFAIGIAVQVAFLSQSLIVTKILGLGAVASLTVCSRVPMQLMQLIWRPFDAFNSRWQIFWAKNETSALTGEFTRMLRLTMGLALLAMTCCLAMNRWFVFIFGKQTLYQGKLFDFFFAVFVIAQVWNHCLSFAFTLAKRMKAFAIVVVLDTALAIAITIFGTKFYGLNGYILFTALYGLVGCGFWYITIKAPEIMESSSVKLLQGMGRTLLLFSILLAGGFLAMREATLHDPAYLLATEIAVVVIAVGLFLCLYRADLWGAISYLKQVRKQRETQAEISIAS